MSVLYPDHTYGSAWQQQEVMCRPAPAGGCLALIKYDRYWSNWINEYDRITRIIDRAKLVSDLTLNDIYDLDRYLWVVKSSVMGVAQEQRFSFDSIIYPEKGMLCPNPVEPEIPSLAELTGGSQ